MTFTNIFVQAGWNQRYRVRYFAYTSSGNQRQKCLPNFDEQNQLFGRTYTT